MYTLLFLILFPPPTSQECLYSAWPIFQLAPVSDHKSLAASSTLPLPPGWDDTRAPVHIAFGHHKPPVSLPVAHCTAAVYQHPEFLISKPSLFSLCSGLSLWSLELVLQGFRYLLGVDYIVLYCSTLIKSWIWTWVIASLSQSKLVCVQISSFFLGKKLIWI